MGYALVDTFVMNPTLTCDVINIKLKNKTLKSELEIGLVYPNFGKADSYTLDERLKIIKRYPNSLFLLDEVSSLVKSLDREDMNLLLNSFSSELRRSQQWQYIYDYANVEVMPVAVDTFKLVSSREDSLEPIIKDHSKYTLIVFSASWCSPCHKQIPLLKKVFNDCKDNLDMVYISVDRSEEEKFWNRLLEKEEIPWRSLFARASKRGLYEYYKIEGIPFSLLVYPNGTVETIDVRVQSDRDKLYKLVKEKF